MRPRAATTTGAAKVPGVPVDARAAPSMPTVRPDTSAAPVVSSDTTTTDVPAGSTVRMTCAAAAGAATRLCPACALRSLLARCRQSGDDAVPGQADSGTDIGQQVSRRPAGHPCRRRRRSAGQAGSGLPADAPGDQPRGVLRYLDRRLVSGLIGEHLAERGQRHHPYRGVAGDRDRRPGSGHVQISLVVRERRDEYVARPERGALAGEGRLVRREQRGRAGVESWQCVRLSRGARPASDGTAVGGGQAAGSRRRSPRRRAARAR